MILLKTMTFDDETDRSRLYHIFLKMMLNFIPKFTEIPKDVLRTKTKSSLSSKTKSYTSVDTTAKR